MRSLTIHVAAGDQRINDLQAALKDAIDDDTPIRIRVGAMSYHVLPEAVDE